MKRAQILEGSSVVLGVFSVFIVANSFLISYVTYLLGIFIVFFTIYISIKKRSKPASPSLGGPGSELFTGSPLEIFGIIFVILSIILLTQNLASPLFFFLYLLLFFLVFMAEPITIWIFLVSILLYFLPDAASNLTNDTFIKLGSLILIAPIAFFLGRELERRQLLNRRIEAKTDDIIQEAEVLKSTTDASSQEEIEAIDEIIEEAESLKEDSKN